MGDLKSPVLLDNMLLPQIIIWPPIIEPRDLKSPFPEDRGQLSTIP
jgi:hypothetical protein